MDGVPTILRIRCKPNFLLNTPDRFSRDRIYCPHRHLACVTISWVGIGDTFQPIVFDSFRVTTFPTLLSRRRGDNVDTSPNNEDEWGRYGKTKFAL